MTDLFGGTWERLPVADADMVMHHDVPLGMGYRALLARLVEETPWRAEAIKIWGKLVPQPRLIAWYGEAGQAYSYSGIELKSEVWTETLLSVKRSVEALAACRFNSVLLNYYRDERDGMGFHSDDEPELGQQPVIASLSLGAERRFQLKHRFRKELRAISFGLPCGSVLIMRGATQRNWKHGVPKERKSCGPRVNLTFRSIVAMTDPRASRRS